MYTREVQRTVHTIKSLSILLYTVTLHEYHITITLEPSIQYRMDLSERLNFSQGIRDLRKLKNFIAPIKVPIIDWLPLYTKQLFFNDLIAGLTVFVLLIPQGMAYSILAGI